MGWMPSYPTFDRNPLDLGDDAAAAGKPVGEYVVDAAQVRRPATSPARTRTRPENFPRVLSIWRANLLGSSGKGNEYFLKHLLGTDSSRPRHRDARRASARVDVTWRDEAPEGKLDLLMTLDFRQTSTTIFSDVVLPGRDLVREARPQHHRHAPVRALVQPGDRAAVADPHRLGRLADHRARSSASSPRPTSACARTSSPSR